MFQEDLEWAISALNARKYKRAFAAFTALAEQGDATAQFYLGRMYYEGQGTEDNEYEAIEWFRRAAASGHVEAQFWLGGAIMYLGKNAPTDAEALDWLKKAAEQGYPDAQYKLAVYCAVGEEYGVEKDERQALQWYLRAGAQGHAEALYNAGFMYLLGDGAAKDEDRAFALLTEAAEKGSCDAKGLLEENESLSKRLK
ncbi:MAG: sel1 repeat family protein [Proteobacteria bacterium]|nr:sel1 repeat family protein [Pseudomonadota bacterium]